MELPIDKIKPRMMQVDIQNQREYKLLSESAVQHFRKC